jgi:predicted transcriptional regulator
MNFTKTESGFIKISTELRRRTDLSSTEKMILGYLLSYQSNNLACYQTEDEISIELGLSLRTLKRSIVNLIQLNIIIKEKASKYTGKRQYKNRKAIIVVSADNTVTPIETIQPEEKAPQIEENVNLNELKQLLDDKWSLKPDIERKLITLVKNCNNQMITDIYKKIKVENIKSNEIENFFKENEIILR